MSTALPSGRPRRTARAIVATVALVVLAGTALAANPAAPAQAYVPPTVTSAPPMGWNSWYNYNEQFNAETVKREADALVSSGLAAKGYINVGIDGGWWTRNGSPGRDASGNIIPDPAFFAGTSFSTMDQLADYLHSQGLRLGLYTDTGASKGCGTAWGSGGNEVKDAKQFAAWGVDYVKVDHCGDNIAGRTTAQSYRAWYDALAQSGRAITLEICNWGQESPWSFGPSTGRTWRTDWDISGDFGHAGFPRSRVTWAKVLSNFDNNNHPGAAGPGAFNDPDYLLLGGFGLTAAQEKSYFGMWAIESAPLVLGTGITTISPAVKALVTNDEIIAVDQDPAYAQATVVLRDGARQVLSKPLAAEGTRAVLLLNRGSSATTVTANWSDIGIPAGSAAVRDLHARADLGTFTDSYSVSLPAYGSALITVKAASVLPLAAASSEVVGTNASRSAIDGNPATIWQSNDQAFPQMLSVDLGATKAISQFTYTPRTDGTLNGTITDYRIEGRNSSGGNWSTLASGTWAADSSVKTASFAPQQARFVRLVALAGVGNWASAAEVSATGPLVVASATASSVFSTFRAANAIDGQASTLWHSSTALRNTFPVSLTLDLGAVKNVAQLGYLPRQDNVTNPNGGTNGVITGYRVSVSTDGSTFTTVATGTWAMSPDLKSAAFAPQQARFVRLEATAGQAGYASAAEVSLYG
ncbi:MAG: alpha-galactosidase [Rhodoglobus sp.]|nr:alpha-galactosidase [Rhodoglobus sp.]